MKKLALAFAAVAALGLALPAVDRAHAQDADKLVVKKNNDAAQKKAVIKKHQPASKKLIIQKNEG